MLNVDIKKNTINKNKEHFSSILVEPLESGHGITLGNSLRRIIFSNSLGLALNSLKINDATHEFEHLSGVREEILELILNLKSLVFSFPLNYKNLKNGKINGYIFEQGPKIITSNYLKFPKNTTKIINPTKYICTVNERKNLILELDLKIGNGYKIDSHLNCNHDYEIYNNKILINTNFCPILKITFLTNLCYNDNGLLKESLIINILTNGSCTPIRCFLNSLKLFHHNFYSIAKNFKSFNY